MTNNQLKDEQIAQWLSAACMVIGDRFATVDELSAANAIRSLAVELKERRKAEQDSEPVAWTDEEELRDANAGACGYLFGIGCSANKFADPRRQIMLYRHAQPAPVVTKTMLQPRKKVDRCDVCTEGARGGCGTCAFSGNL